MPHYTAAGDDGTTTLYGPGRVPKHHQQPETFGAVDEASSALGLARALAQAPRSDQIARAMQERLYLIMAELAVVVGEPIPDAFVTTPEHVSALETIAAELEAEVPAPKQFVLPGATPAGGALDLARTIMRRAEREASRLRAGGHPLNPEILRYLNRASSVLYDLARYEEHHAGREAPRATRHGVQDANA
ncbi:MAG: cob(I)alamin adenosyltransferase [Chloroflexi bacterium]|jgi:cob(I)alamin adenosyltransferase|nr:MAG: cob(I)alamin adenosyltransferase [Chloroflexota bacterium]